MLHLVAGVTNLEVSKSLGQQNQNPKVISRLHTKRTMGWHFCISQVSKTEKGKNPLVMRGRAKGHFYTPSAGWLWQIFQEQFLWPGTSTHRNLFYRYTCKSGDKYGRTFKNILRYNSKTWK
jgi:hypothetical protein